MRSSYQATTEKLHRPALTDLHGHLWKNVHSEFSPLHSITLTAFFFAVLDASLENAMSFFVHFFLTTNLPVLPTRIAKINVLGVNGNVCLRRWLIVNDGCMWSWAGNGPKTQCYKILLFSANYKREGPEVCLSMLFERKSLTPYYTHRKSKEVLKSRLRFYWFRTTRTSIIMSIHQRW